MKTMGKLYNYDFALFVKLISLTKSAIFYFIIIIIRTILLIQKH